MNKITISPEAITRQVSDETVILHRGSGTYFGLDSVGTRIWQLMGEGKSPAEICDLMLDEYEVARDKLERDIGALIKDLLDHDLISSDDASNDDTVAVPQRARPADFRG
jgi:hypothetical protein